MRAELIEAQPYGFQFGRLIGNRPFECTCQFKPRAPKLSQALVNGLDAGYERENAQPHAYADGGYSLRRS